MRQAAEKSGRPVDSICLVAVTKTISMDRIVEASRLGIKDFGENKVQEAAAKAPFPSSTLHMIGALQTNKVRKAVQMFDLIQSVDRMKVATALDRVAGEIGKKQRCLIEIKISTEPTKSGVPLIQAAELIDAFSNFKNLQLEGLMTIGMLNASEEQMRRSFRQMAEFAAAHSSSFGSKPVLSMGMSDDFETAIEEGSTMVRIGRALFGDRT